jgi:hypothetical protein
MDFYRAALLLVRVFGILYLLVGILRRAAAPATTVRRAARSSFVFIAQDYIGDSE